MKIVIIGSGPGLSRSIAQRFGREGFEVILVSRTQSKLEDEVKMLGEDGIKADYIVCDVSDETAFTEVLESLKISLPEVIVFNAYNGGNGSIESETWQSLKRQMDVNVGPAFNILKSLLPEYLNAGKGKLLFTGGGFGINPYPDYIGIGVTKAALRNMIQAQAKTVSNSGVHISTLTVAGIIGGDDPKYAPDEIAEQYWKLYLQQPNEFETEIIY